MSSDRTAAAKPRRCSVAVPARQLDRARPLDGSRLIRWPVLAIVSSRWPPHAAVALGRRPMPAARLALGTMQVGASAGRA